MAQIFKSIAYIILGIAFITLIILVTATCVHNYNHVYSASLSDLGQFGDFMSGTFGLLISMMTLGVSILIAYYLQQRDDENNKKAIEAQKHVAKMQFRYSEVSLFRNECDAALTYWFENLHEPIQLRSVSAQLDKAYYRITTLFPELTDHKIFKDYPSLALVHMAGSSAEYYAKIDIELWSQYKGDVSPEGLKAHDNFYKARDQYYRASSSLIEWANK